MSASYNQTVQDLKSVKPRRTTEFCPWTYTPTTVTLHEVPLSTVSRVHINSLIAAGNAVPATVQWFQCNWQKCTELSCGLFAAIAGDLDPLCVTRSLRSAWLLQYAPTDINRRLDVELVRERAVRQVTVRGKKTTGDMTSMNSAEQTK